MIILNRKAGEDTRRYGSARWPASFPMLSKSPEGSRLVAVRTDTGDIIAETREQDPAQIVALLTPFCNDTTARRYCV